MICAHCGVEVDQEVNCAGCGGAPLLDARYRLEAVIGRGANGTTYRATRLEDAAVLCVKELSYRRIQSFQAEKLFQREVRVLRQLSHAGIPEYIDDFVVTGPKTASLYLVQEFVDGVDLAHEAEERRYREEDAIAMMVELLEILDYLHRLNPPVIHRDIKPQNVMRRRSDGRLMLVDFGSVREVLRDAEQGGSTVAGTFGYMAPEQLYGKASPASDLYGLGVLTIFLLSKRAPEDLVGPDHVLRWREAVQIRPAFEGLLSSLLASRPDARAKDARDVLGRAERVLTSPPRGASRAVKSQPTAEEREAADEDLAAVRAIEEMSDRASGRDEGEALRRNMRATWLGVGAGLVALAVVWAVGLPFGAPWPLLLMGGGTAAFLVGLGVYIMSDPESFTVRSESWGGSTTVRPGKRSDGYVWLGAGIGMMVLIGAIGVNVGAEESVEVEAKKAAVVNTHRARPAARAFHGLRMYDAKVTATRGDAPVSKGAACVLRVNAVSGPQYNCRIQALCGNVLLYGGQGLGYTRCVIRGGEPTRAEDPRGTSVEGDPKLVMNLPAKTLEVSDDAPKATYHVQLRVKARTGSQARE